MMYDVVLRGKLGRRRWCSLVVLIPAGCFDLSLGMNVESCEVHGSMCLHLSCNECHNVIFPGEQMPPI